jgi:hypothetical protein
MVRMLLQGLLIVGAIGLVGCNVVLPTQPPSQIWPRYVEQKAQFDYAASHGCIKLPRLPTPGQPMSDHRQGYLAGYKQSAYAQWNMGQGACIPEKPLYPVGWGWIASPPHTPPTPSYLAGYMEGSEQASRYVPVKK